MAKNSASKASAASAPKSGSGKRVRWLRYVLLGVAGLGVYHILSGPSGAINLLKLRQDNAKLAGELDSLALRKQALEIEKQRLEKDRSPSA